MVVLFCGGCASGGVQVDSSDLDNGTVEVVTEAVETTTAKGRSASERIREVTASFGYDEGESILVSSPEITYSYSDDSFDYYTFTYGDKTVTVLHEYDNWEVLDSYEIRSSRDMELICQGLIGIYPVHGRDLESFRSAEDMAYEWVQHNIAYEVLPEGDARRDRAANVDLDPDEQNMSLFEMFINSSM